MKSLCVKALTRIFKVSDLDNDGILNDNESLLQDHSSDIPKGRITDKICDSLIEKTMSLTLLVSAINQVEQRFIDIFMREQISWS